MASRQRSNPLLGSMDGPAPQIVRSRAPHTSVTAEQRGNTVRTPTAYSLPAASACMTQGTATVRSLGRCTEQAEFSVSGYSTWSAYMGVGRV